jgi:hypothetical protein
MAWVFVATASGSLFERGFHFLGEFLVIGTFTTLTVCVAVVIARVYFRVRLSTADVQTKPFQFSMGHLMVLMFATSAALGVGRLLAPLWRTLANGNAVLLLVIGVAWGSAVVPLIFLALASSTRRQALLGGAIALTSFLGISAGTFLILSEMPTIGQDSVVPILKIGGIANVLTLAGLLMQRREGIRLVRS